MKNIKILLLAGLLMIAACQSDADQSVTPAEEETKELPEMSVYQLPGIWTNQDNEDFPLEELRGKVTVMVMIYTSCKAACPRLVADKLPYREWRSWPSPLLSRDVPLRIKQGVGT